MCMIFTKIQQKTKSGIWEYEIERDTHQLGNIANVLEHFWNKRKSRWNISRKRHK